MSMRRLDYNDNFTDEVKETLMRSEIIATQLRIPLSTDCIILAILEKYHEQQNNIEEIFSAEEYYLKLSKAKIKKVNERCVSGPTKSLMSILSMEEKVNMSCLLFKLLEFNSNLIVWEANIIKEDQEKYNQFYDEATRDYFLNGICECKNFSKEVKSLIFSCDYFAFLHNMDLSVDLILMLCLDYIDSKKYIGYRSELTKNFYECLKEKFNKKRNKNSRPVILDSFSYILTILPNDISNVEELFMEIQRLVYNRSRYTKNCILLNFDRTEISKYLDTKKDKKRKVDSFYQKEMVIPFGEDLTYKAYLGKFDEIFGREKEISRIKRVLSKKDKNNAMLIGKPGVGKTKIVQALAMDFVSGNVPKALSRYRIISINPSNIKSGAKYRGDLEGRIQNFFESIANENVIVFIDEIDAICKNEGSEEHTTVADMMKPYLLNEEIRIIGATNFEGYKIIENNPDIERRLDSVIVDEPSEEETIAILKNVKIDYEEFYNVRIPDSVVEICTNLANRYISVSSLPDKAFDVLDEACAMLVAEGENKKLVLSKDEITEIITEKTGIPINKLELEEKELLLNLEKNLNEKVIGQSEAIALIVSSLKKARIGINNPNKPLASFLFAGKTGVGKTVTAKIISKEYFGKAEIRIDMSEYKTPESIQKLIGSAPGYVGYDKGGILTEAVKHNPYTVILFDEIEKAHPDVHNILLQILDDGRLTDNKGITVNFKNTIIIMTTNVGANVFKKKSLGFGEKDIEQEQRIDSLEEIKKAFKPEIFNRFDEVVIFNSLTEDNCKHIVKNYMESFKERIKEKEVIISYSNKVIDKIVSEGYSSMYGAREIMRTFEKNIVSKVADILIEYNNFNEIKFDVNNDEITTKIEYNELEENAVLVD